MLDIQPSYAAMLEDLASSGLEPGDINARPMEAAEKAATQTPASIHGYVIPYFHMNGKPLPFYRVRLHNFDPKYKQQKETSNHVYFPKNLSHVLKGKSYILLTEGEKKAALAVKLGFPCVALGGVDSWRNRKLVLPVDIELNPKKGSLQGRMPPNTEVREVTDGTAIGMDELIQYAVQHKLHIVIVYDTDVDVGTKPEVQSAAARLGYELRFRGIAFDHIRQLVLPSYQTAGDKVGLDDYLLASGPVEFQSLLTILLNRKSAFPRHPNIQEYIGKRLSHQNGRRDLQALSISILSELDSNGLRLRNTDEGQYYYFNYDDHILYKVDFPDQRQDVNMSGEFQHYLYRRFGIGGADRNLMIWLGTQFTGELPVDDVRPYKVLARTSQSEDRVTYQISDGQFASVAARVDSETPELPGLEVYDNGDRGILFEAGQVGTIDPATLLEHYADEAAKGDPHCNWLEVLRGVRLKDREKSATITALLYYISPWLYRWRGTQLPAEMVLGEAGSGKSTLMELRLSILTGEPKLRNAPTDLRDWHASLAHSGGMHVVDNMQMADKVLRQRLSDEMCRLITEPSPSVEMRKLYTNAGVFKVPVQTVFGITAIQQPFTNADILQRSIILHLDKSVDIIDGNISYDSFWMQHMLAKYGGREGWIAHHLYVLHKFFKLVNAKWNTNYRARHRLIHFEQIMMLMAEVFGIDGKWIPDYLSGLTNRSVSEADWVFQGLSEFVKPALTLKSDKKFCAQDISNWAMNEDEFSENEILTNTRRLGRYMSLHKSMLATALGLIEAGTSNNKQMWKVVARK